MHVTSLSIYPIKSMGGSDLDELILEPRGGQHDRRWMLVDESGRFISQREYAHLACWKVTVMGDTLKIHKQDTNSKTYLIENAKPAHGTTIEVTIWNDHLEANHVSKMADETLSDVLGMKCQLVYMGPNANRPIDRNYANIGEQVSFADGFPYLITTSASIQALSDELGYSINGNRFRPNIVIQHDIPWEEDDWHHMTIGTCDFSLPKPCARCEIPGINQTTGKIDSNVLKILAKLRRQGNKVLFGVNACLEAATGKIQVGDKVVLNKK